MESEFRRAYQWIILGLLIIQVYNISVKNETENRPPNTVKEARTLTNSENLSGNPPIISESLSLTIQGAFECKLTEPDLTIDFNKLTQEFGNSFDEFHEQLKKLSQRQNAGNVSVNGIILIGNTGAGKSTLAQVISGSNSNLKSVEVNPNSGDYIITDDDKIGTDTITSKTIYPDLVVDTESEILVCDSPGFKDTRSPVMELIAASSMKEVLHQIDKIKIVLVIPHSSLKQGSYREDFANLLKQTVNFVKDVNKYKDSFYLVATKAENSFSYKNGKFIVLSDDSIVNGIHFFLNDTRSSLVNRNLMNETKKEEIIKLIDNLMQKNDVNIPLKIKLLRKPSKDGPIQGLKMIQAERLALREILFEKQHFTQKNDEDFGYSISSSALLYVNEIASLFNQYMIGLTRQISKYLIEYYKNSLGKLGDNYQRLKHANNIKLEINQFGIQIGNIQSPLEYTENIIKFLQINKINFGCNLNSKNVSLLQNYLAYLENFSEAIRTTGDSWNSSFTSVTNFIEMEIKNYNLQEEIFFILSGYDFQKKKNSIVPTIDQWTNENYLKNAINDKTFPSFLKTLQLDYKYNSLKPTDYSLEMLNRATYLLLKSAVKVSCEEDNFYIEGYIVRLTEIDFGLIKSCNFKNFMIFAMHTLFIDKDLKEEEFAGKQVIIVARTWHVVGTRKISVDGKSDRNQHFTKAEIGEVGKNGQNGEDGGIFMGIAEILENAQNLVITANGGDGQDGQAGGDGRDGYNGMDGVHYSHDLSDNRKSIYVLYNKAVETIVYEGTPGGVGSDSGGGGRGGLPGKHGSVKLFLYGSHKSENMNEVSIEMKNGDKGEKGPFGKPGIGGTGGCDKVITKTIHYALFIPVSDDYSSSIGSCYGKSKNGIIQSNRNYFQWKLSSITLLPFTECEIMQYYKNTYKDDYKSAQFNHVIDDFINDMPC